jgi:hypothetical protein
LLSSVDKTRGKRIESVIQLMINQCSGSGDFSFENIEPGRLQRAMEVSQVTAVDVTPEEDYNGNFRCPVDRNQALPTLLLASGEPVLGDLEKSYVDALITNPFLLLNDPNLVQKVRDRLDHVVGLDAAQDLFSGGGQSNNHNQAISPVSRREVTAAFTLGVDKSHRDATNFALADLLFGRKLVGQPELWLGVLYLLMRDEIPYLHNTESFMKAFKEHMTHRMRTETTFMTLSGLPVEPMVPCPVDIALWYCVNSPLIVDNQGDAEDDRNRLRSFGSGARYMAELLEKDVLGYTYDRAWTLRQLSMYKAFAYMMKADKNNDQTWRQRLRAQYQNSLTLSDGTVVFLDGPAHLSGRASPSLPGSSVSIGGVSYSLSAGETIALSRFVDRSKTVGVVKLPRDISAVAAVEGKDADFTAVQNYGIDPTLARLDFSVPICPSTLRPYMFDQKTGLPWRASFESVYGPLNKQLSAFGYFIRYVNEYKGYPTMEALIKFMSVREAGREDGKAKDTLPAQVDQIVRGVFSSYQEVLGPSFAYATMAKDLLPKDISQLIQDMFSSKDNKLGSSFSYVTVQEFLDITRASMSLTRREAMEKGGQGGQRWRGGDVDYNPGVVEAMTRAATIGTTATTTGTTATTTGTTDTTTRAATSTAFLSGKAVPAENNDRDKDRDDEQKTPEKGKIDDDKVKEAINILASYAIDKAVDYLVYMKNNLSK